LGEVTPIRVHGLSPPVHLETSHDVTGFDCGNPDLNDWLRNRARTSEGKYSRTYVVCEGSAVVGYYCIANGGIQRKALPGKLRREQGQPNETPVAIIGRLARDIRYRGTGLGADLLVDALKRIISASEIIGMRCILVHAVDDVAMAFYTRCSDRFMEWPADSRTLFLPLETAIAAVVAAAEQASAAGSA
jgi:hypothetical protein